MRVTEPYSRGVLDRVYANDRDFMRKKEMRKIRNAEDESLELVIFWQKCT